MKKKKSQSLFELMTPSVKDGTRRPDTEEGKIIQLERQVEPDPDGNETSPGPGTVRENQQPAAIKLRLDTAAVLAFGLVVLLVIAFVAGRVSAPGQVIAARDAGDERLEHIPGDAAPPPAGGRHPDLSMRPRKNTAVAAQGKWTIQVASFNPWQEDRARTTVAFLKKKGFTDAWMKDTDKHFVVYIGHYKDQNTPAAKAALKRVRGLRHISGRDFKTALIRKLR